MNEPSGIPRSKGELTDYVVRRLQGEVGPPPAMAYGQDYQELLRQAFRRSRPNRQADLRTSLDSALARFWHDPQATKAFHRAADLAAAIGQEDAPPGSDIYPVAVEEVLDVAPVGRRADLLAVLAYWVRRPEEFWSKILLRAAERLPEDASMTTPLGHAILQIDRPFSDCELEAVLRAEAMSPAPGPRIAYRAAGRQRQLHQQLDSIEEFALQLRTATYKVFADHSIVFSPNQKGLLELLTCTFDDEAHNPHARALLEAGAAFEIGSTEITSFLDPRPPLRRFLTRLPKIPPKRDAEAFQASLSNMQADISRDSPISDNDRAAIGLCNARVSRDTLPPRPNYTTEHANA